MTHSTRLRCFQIAALLGALFSTKPAIAQSPTNQGSLTIGARRTIYKSVVAFRGKASGESRIIVLATRQGLTADAAEKVKGAGAEEMISGLDAPYLKAVFSENGELQCLAGEGSNSSFLERKDPLEGKATIADGRIRGALKLIKPGDFGKEVALDFDVPIDAEVKVAAPAKLEPPVKPTVTGKFIGNGKNAAIKFVTVEEHEEFSGKPAITLIFTEKNPATVKKPSFDAGFGKLGSALILNVHYDGAIFGCQVAHSAHSKQGFSALGETAMVDFEIVGGNVTGEVSTGKTLEFFGDTWDIDLKFAAPLPEKLRNAPAAAPKPVSSETREMKKEPKAPAGPRIAARKLPLPSDATDVEFKQIVEQIHFASPRSVETVAKELSAKLKQQGWKESGRDLVGKASAILKREQGEAKLTIMVQPKAGGSSVKLFTEKLEWEGGDEAKPPAPKKSLEKADDDDDDEIEKAAGKILNDALKKIPKGF